MSAIVVDDRAILNAVGQDIYVGNGYNALADYLGDVLGDWDEVSDALDDALGAVKAKVKPGKRAVAMAREKIKTFRVEPAAANLIVFPVAGPFTQPLVLPVIRDYKVVDMLVTAIDVNGDHIPAELFTLTKVTIKGTQQSASNNDQNLAAFGTGNGGPFSIRPKIDWDTVNSTVPLTANVNYVGPTPLPFITSVYVLFDGVAARGSVS
jgi:hypothetical protein